MSFDVIGHLIHGERTDWVPRARIIPRRASPAFESSIALPGIAGPNAGGVFDEFAAPGGKTPRVGSAAAHDADLDRGRHPSSVS